MEEGERGGEGKEEQTASRWGGEVRRIEEEEEKDK